MFKINEEKRHNAIKEKRLAEIESEFQKIDTRRIRSMAEGDDDFLRELNEQAETLRQELRTLEND